MVPAIWLAWLGVQACFGLRPHIDAFASESFDRDAKGQEVCSGIVCERALNDKRINQGRFLISANDTKKVAWKLKHGSSLNTGEACLDQERVANAQIVPWVDRQNPTEASTIEVFVDPKKMMQLFDNAAPAFVCASDWHDVETRKCLCKVSNQNAGPGLFPHLGSSLMEINSVADASLAAERRCDSMWVPEGAGLSVLILSVLSCVAAVEALMAFRRLKIGHAEEEKPNLPQELVLMSNPNAQLYSGTSSAVSFAALVMTTQTLAVAILVKFGAPEGILWTMIASSGLFGIFGIWLFYTVVCRNQLVQSCLNMKICVCNKPSTSRLTALLAAAIFAYVLIIAVCLLRTVVVDWSLVNAVRVIAVAISAMVGPVMSLLKALRSSLETEQASLQIKMQAEVFDHVVQAAAGAPAAETGPDAPWKKSSDQIEGWRCVDWSKVVSSCRRGDFLNVQSFTGDETGQSEGPHWIFRISLV